MAKPSRGYKSQNFLGKTWMDYVGERELKIEKQGFLWYFIDMKKWFGGIILIIICIAIWGYIFYLQKSKFDLAYVDTKGQVWLKDLNGFKKDLMVVDEADEQDTKIDTPRTISVSPNNKMIAVDLFRQNNSEKGVAIYDIKSANIKFITEGEIGNFAWSPDSKYLLMNSYTYADKIYSIEFGELIEFQEAPRYRQDGDYSAEKAFYRMVSWGESDRAYFMKINLNDNSQQTVLFNLITKEEKVVEDLKETSFDKLKLAFGSFEPKLLDSMDNTKSPNEPFYRRQERPGNKTLCGFENKIIYPTKSLKEILYRDYSLAIFDTKTQKTKRIVENIIDYSCFW